MSRRSLIVLANLVLLTFTCQYASAATMPISGMQLGQVIKIGSRQFVKISTENDFMALQTSIKTMQAFTTADCNSFPTPSGTNYTAVGTLMDARDGKSYEIRKFADGKCWMVDNLRYGGGTDGSSDYCVGKSTSRTANSQADSAATATNGLNPADGSRNTLVGDCIDFSAIGETSGMCVAGTTICGYSYNWPAAIQSLQGWAGNSFQPPQPTQGICPDGWHVPSSGSSGEYQTLHTTAGSPSTGFWQVGGNWNGVATSYYSGAFYISSTQYNSSNYYQLYYTSSLIYPSHQNGSYSGVKSTTVFVRCIKD